MDIAIDITPIENAHSRRGTGVYAKNLIEALKKYEYKHTYSLFTRGHEVPKNADIVHYPYFDPFFLTLPLSRPVPTVVTVHDLIPLVFPDKFPAGFRGSLKWQIQKFSLKGVRRVITDSKSSKKDITRIVHINPASVDVVYLAPTVKPASDKISGYPEHFVLYVGDVNWNKNVSGLIRSIGHRMLVLAGKSFLDNTLRETQEINMLIASLGIEKQIVRTGYVKDLAPLYRSADCLVVPSFYEGFGLPVLDAMNCGCPVVAADNSSLTEIAGPSIRVSTDPDSIADGIRKAIQDRKRLVDEGLEWVKQFTWKKVAADTADVYEKAFNNYPGV